MKRGLALTLALALLLVSGLGAATFAVAEDDFSQEVTIKWMLEGSNVTDDTAVIEAVNAYLKEKINAKLQVIWGTWGDFDQNVVNSINGGDDIDIYFTCSWTSNEYSAYANKGAYVRLDDPENNLLEQYAPGLFDVLPAVLADAAAVEGADGVGVYGIPGYKEVAQEYTWDINTPLLEELGYTVDDIGSYYDLGPILQKAKELKGADFYPLNIEGGVLVRIALNADVVDSNLVLVYPFDPEHPSQSGTEIKSLLELPEFAEFAKKTREYYLAGYINPVMATADAASSARTDAQLTGQYLIGTQVYSPGYDAQASQERGFQVTFKPTHKPIISTTSARGAMMAISTSSKNPERALAFLNLLNTDPTLFTLIAYGVEGVHYNLTDDGKVEFTDKRADYQPWRNGLGNITQLPLTVDDDPQIWEKFAEFNDAEGVPILGFALNQEPIQNEMAALANISKEYLDGLCVGVVDPDVVLPEAIEKLKANGIDKVVAEANAQVQAFLDAKGE
ncbi:MAG: ABC transporter substrate-binding protein [Oscillospiraceae bacterium]|jgi:putative aldouronate transport system substrate-binding protein|nr:ABC transporter substrate-binding protein [Oscillospiraceae bacterium]